MSVIIAAGGSGTRMGGLSKPLLLLCGKRVLDYSIESFLSCKATENIVVSAKRSDIRDIEKLCEPYGLGEKVFVTEGGDDRQASVKNALDFLFDNSLISEYIAIHDAARPLITEKDITAAFHAARACGTAVCASRVRDTMKRTDKTGVIIESVEREDLWQIQTPQIFLTDAFVSSLALAEKKGVRATDESSLVASASFDVKLFECPASNIKITYGEDLAVAKAILAERCTEEKCSE